MMELGCLRWVQPVSMLADLARPKEWIYHSEKSRRVCCPLSFPLSLQWFLSGPWYIIALMKPNSGSSSSAGLQWELPPQRSSKTSRMVEIHITKLRRGIFQIFYSWSMYYILGSHIIYIYMDRQNACGGMKFKNTPRGKLLFYAAVLHLWNNNWVSGSICRVRINCCSAAVSYCAGLWMGEIYWVTLSPLYSFGLT